jgi:hypothetical protein
VKLVSFSSRSGWLMRWLAGLAHAASVAWLLAIVVLPPEPLFWAASSMESARARTGQIKRWSPMETGPYSIAVAARSSGSPLFNSASSVMRRTAPVAGSTASEP